MLFGELPDPLAGDLLAGLVSLVLDDAGKLDLGPARQADMVVCLQQIGGARLAGLRIHPDDRLECPADIARVDGKVGHLPDIGIGIADGVHALADGVLVAAGKGGMHQLAGIGMAFMHGKLVAELRRLDQLVDVREGQGRVDALGEHVQPQRDDIDIAGPLAIAEQRAFHPVRAGHQAKLGRGHGAAAVVMRVKRQDHRLALAEIAVHPFDLVGIDVRRRHLHRRRKIDDGGVGGGRLPDIHHRLADLERVIKLGAGEALRRILQAQIVRPTFRDAVGHHLRAVDGDLLDPVAVGLEHHPALQRRGGVVEVQDGVRRAVEALDRAVDQMLARLRQHLDGDIIRHMAALDQLAKEIVVGLGCRGESDLDLLEAHIDEKFEHPHLAGAVHRLD